MSKISSNSIELPDGGDLTTEISTIEQTITDNSTEITFAFDGDAIDLDLLTNYPEGMSIGYVTNTVFPVSGIPTNTIAEGYIMSFRKGDVIEQYGYEVGDATILQREYVAAAWTTGLERRRFAPSFESKLTALPDNTTLQAALDDKLEVANILAGTNVTVDVAGNDVTINSSGGDSHTLTLSSFGADDYADMPEGISVIQDGSYTIMNTVQQVDANVKYIVQSRYTQVSNTNNVFDYYRKTSWDSTDPTNPVTSDWVIIRDFTTALDDKLTALPDNATLQSALDDKLEATNILAGTNISLDVAGNDITINGNEGLDYITVTDVDDLAQFPEGVSLAVISAPSSFSGSLDYIVRTVKNVDAAYQYGVRANGSGDFVSTRAYSSATWSSIVDDQIFSSALDDKLAAIEAEATKTNIVDDAGTSVASNSDVYSKAAVDTIVEDEVGNLETLVITSGATVAAEVGYIYGLDNATVELNLDAFTDFTDGYPLLDLVNIRSNGESVAVTAVKGIEDMTFKSPDLTSGSGTQITIAPNGSATLAVSATTDILVVQYSTTQPQYATPA